ncbi:hypothetical protein RHGRI_032425 [Rhododendron griersonianum]|uniref:Uncharacterized protein n=1 Tax=Rhododendron griersonianum TaxID=479676 RepID=A0AAV6IGM5_9ERIC|nr:hypothetical protein RHGRI_032425 [Rhododendron griersonianum]
MSNVQYGLRSIAMMQFQMRPQRQQYGREFDIFQQLYCTNKFSLFQHPHSKRT